MTVSTEGFREVEPVVVEDGHRSKRRICGTIWPRCDPRLLPTSRRVSVRTPAGIYVKVIVRLRVVGDYVVAVADPVGRVHGEDEDASCEFPLSCELEAERIGLESL